MKLSVLANAAGLTVVGSEDIEVTGFAIDNRKVAPRAAVEHVSDSKTGVQVVALSAKEPVIAPYREIGVSGENTE